MSHYACMEEECIQKCFVAFKTRDELIHHQNKVHKNVNEKKTKISLGLTGFKFENGKTQDGTEANKILDSEGRDFTKQFLSQAKVKTIKKNQTTDQKFDIRDFLEQTQQDGKLTLEQERGQLRKAEEASNYDYTKGKYNKKNKVIMFLNPHIQ